MIPPNLCVPKETHSMWDFFNVTLGRYYQYLFGLKRKQIDLRLFDQQLCNVISHRDSFYGNEWDQSRLWSQGCFWRNRLCQYVDRYSPFMYQWVEENWYWKSKVSKWQIFPSRILPTNLILRRKKCGLMKNCACLGWILPSFHVLAFKNIHIHPSDQGGGRRRRCFDYRHTHHSLFLPPRKTSSKYRNRI